MNKEEFTNFLAKKMSVTKKSAEESISTFVEGVISVIEEGESVNLIGFGNFHSIHMKEREGVNPKTKERMTIPPYWKLSFKAGQRIKDAANNAKRK